MSISEINSMDAVNMTIEAYIKSTADKRKSQEVDGEDTPIIGIFKNGMVIVDVDNDGGININLKGGSPMEFKDININIFGSDEEVSHE